MSLTYIKDVVTLELDIETCVGCGICAEVCPHGVFEVADGKARLLDRDACIECGACATNCPVDAIQVEAGVGCASAFINAALNRSSDCCCGPPTEDDSSAPGCGASPDPPKKGCC